jgi:hypothetical protein
MNGKNSEQYMAEELYFNNNLTLENTVALIEFTMLFKKLSRLQVSEKLFNNINYVTETIKEYKGGNDRLTAVQCVDVLYNSKYATLRKVLENYRLVLILMTSGQDERFVEQQKMEQDINTDSLMFAINVQLEMFLLKMLNENQTQEGE